MGNLNCMHCMGHKTVNSELNGEAKSNRTNPTLRKHFCFPSEEKENEENGRNYFSSFKIFDRQRSCNRSKGSREDREGNNSCPLCKSDKAMSSSEQEDGGDQEDELTSKRNQSLLQPPFKPLSTPGEALIDNEVILLKVGNCTCIYQGSNIIFPVYNYILAIID